MSTFPYTLLADEAELEGIGKRDLAERRRAMAAKGKWPQHEIERLEYRSGVFFEMARLFRKAAEAEARKVSE